MVLDTNNSQGDFPYQWVITKDRSYTLKSNSEPSEWMHSLHGAYSESQFIYGDAIRYSLSSMPDSQGPLNVLSMGLGLGYVELIAILECLKEGRSFNIESFEIDVRLKNLFQFQCVLGLKILNNLDLLKTDSFELEFKDESKTCLTYGFSVQFYINHYFNFFLNDYGSEYLKITFSSILESINDKNNSEIKSHKSNFSGLIKNNLKLNGPLNLNVLLDQEILNENELVDTQVIKNNLIFYDAFSSNTQEELWSEEFLDKFIGLFSDPDHCVFSTYAKVGSLNRALKKNGFRFVTKKGFANKRESSFAVKTNTQN